MHTHGHLNTSTAPPPSQACERTGGGGVASAPRQQASLSPSPLINLQYGTARLGSSQALLPVCPRRNCQCTDPRSCASLYESRRRALLPVCPCMLTPYRRDGRYPTADTRRPIRDGRYSRPTDRKRRPRDASSAMTAMTAGRTRQVRCAAVQGHVLAASYESTSIASWVLL